MEDGHRVSPVACPSHSLGGGKGSLLGEISQSEGRGAQVGYREAETSAPGAVEPPGHHLGFELPPLWTPVSSTAFPFLSPHGGSHVSLAAAAAFVVALMYSSNFRRLLQMVV